MAKPILVFYLSVPNMSMEEIKSYSKEVKRKLKKSFKKSGDYDDFIFLFIPIRDGKTRVELLKP